MAADGVSSATAAVSNPRTRDAVSIGVLKKALDIQAQNAQQLVQSVPQPQAQAAANPPHLGKQLDTYA